MNDNSIKHVLLCRPNFFQVEYSINPWMNLGQVDQSLAMSQWQSLKGKYQKLGIKVSVIPQRKGVPDMVFAADSGLVKDGKFILSNFKYPERQNESLIYRDWFLKQGYEVEEFPPGIHCEGGGETIVLNDFILLGIGFRSSNESAKSLSVLAGKEVIVLELADDHFYHLDTCLFVLNSETAFYYEKAFKESSLLLLQKLFTNLIQINEEEAVNFAANCVVSGTDVLIQSGNPKMSESIQKLGYTAHELDLSEFQKAGGGIHCLSNILE